MEILRRELPSAAKNLGLEMDRNAEVFKKLSPDLPVFFENLRISHFAIRLGCSTSRVRSIGLEGLPRNQTCE